MMIHPPHRTRTERSREIKAVVTDLLDKTYGVVSVRLGTGTASGWVTIKTKHSVEYAVRNIVELQLDKRNLLHIYYSDGPECESNFCVGWSI